MLIFVSVMFLKAFQSLQIDMKTLKGMDLSKNQKPILYVMTQPWYATSMT
jgi:hypothetical protein